MSKSVVEYTDDVEAWQRLARAIIVRASKDYRSRLRRLKRCELEMQPVYEAELKRLRHFFTGTLFATISDLDGQALLERLENEVCDKR